MDIVKPTYKFGNSEFALKQPLSMVFVGMIKTCKNYCDHSKDELKFYARKLSSKPAIPIIRDACINLKHWANNKGKFLETLNWVRKSTRKMRSQRREAVAIVAQCLLDHTDIITGEPTKYNFEGKTSLLNAGLIAAITGLHYQRVLRALDELENGGYLKVKHIPCFKRNGVFRRKRILLKVCKRLFMHLGITEKKYRETFNERIHSRELEPKLENDMQTKSRLRTERITEELKAKGKSGFQGFKDMMQKLRLKPRK